MSTDVARTKIRQGLKVTAYRKVKRAAAAAGFNITRKHFYSPIPNELAESVWGERSDMRGVCMDLDQQLAWLEQIRPYVSEFQPPVSMANGYIFEYANGSIGNGDADVLYGVIRATCPKRVVELGSGHSSAVIQYAIAQCPEVVDYEAFDPYPTDHLGTLPVKAVSAEMLPESVITSLSSGDMLFVDTTHTVKIGGDVVRIVLDLLPLLPSGVLVHFHDIFLPYQYPRSFFEENEFYWAEQYLLQAFLAFNARFRVVAALHALFRERGADFRDIVPSAVSGCPGSFWLITE